VTVAAECGLKRLDRRPQASPGVQCRKTLQCRSVAIGNTVTRSWPPRCFRVPLGALQAFGVDDPWFGGRIIACDAKAHGSVRMMGR
jgi:hypothetical protein